MPLANPPNVRVDLRPIHHGLLIGWLSSSLCAMSAACAPEPSEQHGADAEVYLRAFCEDVCAKFDECAPLPQSTEECDVNRCVDGYNEPCLVEKVEWVRCLVERESCEDYFDAYLDTTPNGICFEFVAPTIECAAEHPGEH